MTTPPSKSNGGSDVAETLADALPEIGGRRPKGSEAHIFPIGARVHHANQLWTQGWTETQRQANPQWGWGTVREVRVFGDSWKTARRGDFEVGVRCDAPLTEGGSAMSWWPGWLIDEVKAS